MTVKELKQILENHPDNMDVFIDERVSDFTYGLLNSVHKREDVNFMEEPGGKVISKDTIIILSED